MTTSGTSTVFPGRFTTSESPSRWASSSEKEVVYYPASGLRHVEHPLFHRPLTGPEAGATSTAATPRSCSRASGSTLRADRFSGPNRDRGSQRTGSKPATSGCLRNLQEFPRAWVVHDARVTIPIHRTFAEKRAAEAMQEILYAGDPIWNDSTRIALTTRTALPGWAMTILPRITPLPVGQGAGSRPRRSR